METRDTQRGEAFLPIGEVARQLGVSIETIRRWEKHGKIHAIRTVGGQRRFPISEIHRLRVSA